MKFPIKTYPGIPLNSHPGAFGNCRKFNFHEGVDLYGTPGDKVFAIQDGLVIYNRPFTGAKVGLNWWENTDAVCVQDSTGFWVYGELVSTLKEGQEVKEGDYIGNLIPVLPAHKLRKDIPGHSATMLHIERYNTKYEATSQEQDDVWSSWNKREERPIYLEDPTPILIDILLQNNQQPKFLFL